jgi:hypothetical protein
VPPIPEPSVVLASETTIAAATDGPSVTATSDKNKKTQKQKNLEREERERRKNEKRRAETAKREQEKAQRKEQERARKEKEQAKREQEQAKREEKERKRVEKKAAQEKAAQDKKNMSKHGDSGPRPMPVGTETSASADAQAHGGQRATTDNDAAVQSSKGNMRDESSGQGNAQDAGRKSKSGSISLTSFGGITSGLLKVLPGFSGSPKVSKETAERCDLAKSETHDHGVGRAEDRQMLEHMEQLSHHLDRHIQERLEVAQRCSAESGHLEGKQHK